MNASNAGLTDEQRAINRLRWLLVESAARANIPVTQGVVDAMAKQILALMSENQLVLCWMSEFEKDVAAGEA